MKKIYLLIFWVLFVSVTGAQTDQSIPPTPEAWSFIKMVERPIDIHSGAMSKSISLFTLDTKDLDVDVNLSYCSNGVQVGDIASCVGMGWTLDYGGMITCRVNGVPDIDWWTESWQYTQAPSSDTKRDIFYYSIPGHKGRFLLEGDINNGVAIKRIEKDDVSISFSVGQMTFTITDEKGIQYIYSVLNYVKNKRDYVAFSSGESDPDDMGAFSNWHELFYPATWLLSKIVLPNGDEIKYYYNNGSEITYESTHGLNKYFNPALLPEGMNIVPGSIVTHTQTITSRPLSRIEYKNTTVDFYYNLSREDLPGDYALTEVRVTNNGNLNKLLYLDYEFKTSFDTHLNKPAQVFKRLFLKEIRERGMYSSDIMSLYKFDYDNTVLPNRQSYRSDAWGYFNNDQGNDYGHPKIYIYPDASRAGERYWPIPKPAYNGTQLIIDGRNLETNTTLGQAGLLRKITYSTGGYTEIVYEPNQFLWFDEGNTARDINQAYNITGGGFRIKTIKNVSLSSPDIVTDYKYNFKDYPTKSSGAIAYFPQFAYPFVVQGNYSDQGLYNLSYYDKILVRGFNSLNSITDKKGLDVGYRSVTVEQQNNGKVIHNFSFPGAYGEDNDNPSGCSDNLQGYCDNLFLATPTTIINNAGSVSGSELQTTQPNTLPFSNNTLYDWNRGLPIKESYYDKNGVLLKEVNIKHKLFYNGEFVMDGDEMELGFFLSIYNFTKWSNYKILLNVAKKIEERIETTYSNGASIINKEEFVYGTNHLLPVEVMKTNSFGKTIKTKIKYAGDYPGITASASDENVRALFKLQQKHVISAEIEKIFSQKNINDEEKIIASEINIYNINPLNNELLSLVETKRIETANGIDASQFAQSSIINNALSFEAAYKAFELNKYDNKGDIVNTQISNNIKTTYIWNDIGTYPIAKVVGAGENEVAYTSFEWDQLGNWEQVDVARISAGLGGLGPINRYYDDGTFTLRKSNLPAGSYVISYWVRGAACNVNGTNGVKGKTVGFWSYYEHVVSLNSGGAILVNGTGLVDELRLFPASALMTTFTYKPYIGMSSTADPNNHISCYDYDTYRRLQYVRDEDQNIIKRFCYNLYNQPNNCEIATTSPFWQLTGVTRLKQCAGDIRYFSQVRQHQEIDINPQSATYNTYQWIDDGVDNTADVSEWYDNSAIRCKAGSTTGEIEKQQTDGNPCSPLYNQTRWVDGGINTTACPITGSNTIYARLEIIPYEPENTSSSSESWYYKTVAVYLRFYSEATCVNRIAVPRSINYSVRTCGYMQYLDGINTHCYPDAFTGTALNVSEINLADPTSYEGLWILYDEFGEPIYRERWVDDYELMSVDNNCVILPPLQPDHSPGF